MCVSPSHMCVCRIAFLILRLPLLKSEKKAAREGSLASALKLTRSKKSLIPSSVQENLILKDPNKKITDQGSPIANLRSLI